MLFPLQEGLGRVRLAKLHLHFFPSKISGDVLVWSRGRSFPAPSATSAFLVPCSLALPCCLLRLQQHLHSVVAPGSLAPSQRKRSAGHPSTDPGEDTPGRPACRTEKLNFLFAFPHVRCSQISLCPHTQIGQPTCGRSCPYWGLGMERLHLSPMTSAHRSTETSK